MVALEQPVEQVLEDFRHVQAVLVYRQLVYRRPFFDVAQAKVTFYINKVNFNQKVLEYGGQHLPERVWAFLDLFYTGLERISSEFLALCCMAPKIKIILGTIPSYNS